MAVTENSPEIRDSRVYWYVVLDQAHERGEYDRAAQAQRQLERLGVKVRYQRQTRRGEADGRH
jgi:hypothetical protein